MSRSEPVLETHEVIWRCHYPIVFKDEHSTESSGVELSEASHSSQALPHCIFTITSPAPPLFIFQRSVFTFQLTRTQISPIFYKNTMAELLLTSSSEQAFENTSTSIAASQMRNALNKLSDTVSDPKEKKVKPKHSSFTFPC